MDEENGPVQGEKESKFCGGSYHATKVIKTAVFVFFVHNNT